MLAHWPEIMGSERLVEALLDRVTHLVIIPEVDVQCCRLTDEKTLVAIELDLSKF